MRQTFFVSATLLLFSACSVQQARQSAAARSSLIGLSAESLDLCAGLPTKTEKLDPVTELRSYEFKTDASNTVNVTVPIIGGGFAVGQGGTCAATFKMVQGRVAELRYAGDTDSGPGGRDAVCAPIISHCLDDLPKPPAK